jgi:hypothetical protein
MVQLGSIEICSALFLQIVQLFAMSSESKIQISDFTWLVVFWILPFIQADNNLRKKSRIFIFRSNGSILVEFSIDSPIIPIPFYVVEIFCLFRPNLFFSPHVLAFRLLPTHFGRNLAKL